MSFAVCGTHDELQVYWEENRYGRRTDVPRLLGLSWSSRVMLLRQRCGSPAVRKVSGTKFDSVITCSPNIALRARPCLEMRVVTSNSCGCCHCKRACC